ncbi:hypothetical protein SKAU_G00336740 [Synaphobranchus kaupii]|uniref:Uncharacterized protein n=1 Tax=Synaphobranchus kaupii TaxID=118154 RepID=A0A9Q1IGV5_SYNKA|nr:hypothetical protein SKAU_G00336740 [Synaphobranchus kaupii]
MLIRDILLLSLSFWPFLFGHCFFTSFLLLFQFTQGGTSEVMLADYRGEGLLASTVAETIVPQMEPWWKEIVILGTVGCACVAFLLLTVIICYKAYKEVGLCLSVLAFILAIAMLSASLKGNHCGRRRTGPAGGEYAMSSRNKKTVDTNNAVV